MHLITFNVFTDNLSVSGGAFLWAFSTMADHLFVCCLLQVATAVSVIALVYMKLFLQESNTQNAISAKASSETNCCLLEKSPKRTFQMFKDLPSLDDAISLLKTRLAFP